MSFPHPQVSVVIPTKDRGAKVVPTVETVLANTRPDFEVIVVDQSVKDETENAVQPFLVDHRLRYVRSETSGAGRARNIGISYARCDTILFTDDDCTVPTEWVDVMSSIFHTHPRVAVAFCSVEAGPHDTSKGFIPAYTPATDKLVRNFREKCRARGMGAGMAVRKSVALSFGGFDEGLGPGTSFPDCEDGDLAVRALMRGWWIFETNKVAVVHAGFRTWQEGKELSKRNWVGVGAAYAKPLKCGHWSFVSVVLYEALIIALWSPFSKILRLKRPQGFRRFLFFVLGFCRGLNTPVERKTLSYMPHCFLNSTSADNAQNPIIADGAQAGR